MSYKIPISVLVVIHTPNLEILLLERARHPGLWQSVTGSTEAGETLLQTAQREVQEETGIAAPASDFKPWNLINNFRITLTPERFAPGTTHNREHVFSLCVPAPVPVTLAPSEHLAWRWVPWQDAAAACFSWSNRDAILMLGHAMTIEHSFAE
ncbi:MAG TPA: dihydroneopterin triphosphate diphosphatase [Rhodocyclaceae bacterium]|nr:dihydroneopterin triphosphate diphosphatase [Rhodocyclaceae bacterium]